MALAQRTKQTETIREGTMTVRVSRPGDAQGAASTWDLVRDGRTHFRPSPTPSEDIETRYTVTQDNGMLERMVDRARGNRSGVSVRAMATCHADGRIDVALTASMLRYLVASAANNSGLRRVEGPLTVRVKLLSPPAPYVLICRECHRPGSEHVFGEIERQGNWRETGETDSRGRPFREWSLDMLRLDPYWWCPTPASTEAN